MEKVYNLVFFLFTIILLNLTSCIPPVVNKDSEHSSYFDTTHYFYINQDTFLISVHKITDSIDNSDYPPIRYGKWNYYYPFHILKQIEKYNEYGKLIRRTQYYKNGIPSYDFVLNQDYPVNNPFDTSYIYKYSESGKLKYHEIFYLAQQKGFHGTLRIKKYFSDDEILEKEVIDSLGNNSIEIKYYTNGQRSSYREQGYYESYHGKIMEWDTTGKLILNTSIDKENMTYY